MRNGLFILFAGMILIGCQKDDESGNNNNDNISCAQFNPNLTYGTLTDIEGNTYKTIQIGTQTWMAENLRVGKYRDGTLIPNVTDNIQWANNTAGAWCYYNNDANNNIAFGKLYNFYAVNNSKNICPSGWHIPTDEDWNNLVKFLDPSFALIGYQSIIAGGNMKSDCPKLWQSPNTNANNTSGFSGLPGGARNTDGSFVSLGLGGSWWSSTQPVNDYAWFRLVFNNNGSVLRGSVLASAGYSVRCIKD